MGKSTVCMIVDEVCEAIWNALHADFVKIPSNEEEWLGVSRQFEQSWNFPNCVGAIDGKHIVIQAPNHAGSSFFNYKGAHSVVLLAVCDAHYRFIMIDVGDTSRHSDGGVFSNSQFGKALASNSLSLPPARPLPGINSQNVPYVIVGDAAFPLKPNMMRPYPGRELFESRSIFNYRLSRARRVIENSFGILASRWRIFRRPIIATPSHVVTYTKAAIALHNYLRTTESTVYCPPGFIDAEDGVGNVVNGSWREEPSPLGLEAIRNLGGNRYSLTASTVRDVFTNYFISARGEVSWQYQHIHRTS